MDKIATDIINLSVEIQELFAFVSGFISDSELSNRIQQLLKIEKAANYNSIRKQLDDLYEAVELISFIISEKEGSSSQIVDSPYMKNIKLSNLFNKLDLISNDLYKAAKKNPELQTKEEKKIRLAKNITDVYDDFGIELDIFSQLNPEFLLPTEEYFTKAELPKGAIIAKIHVDNTQNLIVSTQKVVDRQYVDKHYPNMSINSGVTAEVIDRFSILQHFENTPGETTMLPLDTKEVYQDLGTKYRKLIHYPKNDYVRNSDYLPLNSMVTNFENKRILMLRQNIPKGKIYTPVKEDVPGKIKRNFFTNNKFVADAVFNALYTNDMTDEQITKLGIGAVTLQDSLPTSKDEIKILREKFDKLINRKSLKKLL